MRLIRCLKARIRPPTRRIRRCTTRDDFPQEKYVAADSESSVGDWLTGKLEDYVEGMLDAVFTENPALAAAAGDAATLSRTDMEVFCPGITPDIVSGCRKP